MSYSYIVSYGTSTTGPWTQAGTSTVSSFTINGLSAGAYYVQVVAVDTVSGLQSAPVVGGPFIISSSVQESASGTTITAAGQVIYSSQTPGQAAPAGGPFDTWGLTSQGGQVVHNGATDSNTAAVTELYYSGHYVYQQSSNGNSFGTPGWWQWTGVTSASTIFVSGFVAGSFTDSAGNVFSTDGEQDVSETPAGGGAAIALGTINDIGFNAAQIAYYNNTVYIQDSRDSSWHTFTPGSNTFSGAVTAPPATSSSDGWQPCASPIAAALTISGISLSNATVTAGSPAGTVVGAVTVSMSSGSFGGTLSVGGTNASSFSLSGSNLQEASSLTAGNYSISLTATQASATNSPLTSPFTIVAQAAANGPGPTSLSQFITVDFTSAVAGRSGQQTVAQQMYGYSSSSLSNPQFGSNFGAWAQSNITSALATINAGLVYLKNGGINYWNSDLSVNTSTLSNLVNNFYKTDPLGIAKVIIGADWDGQIVSGTATTAQYATAMANLASYLSNFTMPNGKKFPLAGVMGRDEPDGTFSEAQCVSYYNAMGPAVKGVNSNLLICGPQLSYIGWTDFGSKVSSLDVFSYDYFQGGGFSGLSDTTPLTNNNFQSISTSAASAVSTNIKATLYGGMGDDWNCTDATMASYIGAMFLCQGAMIAMNTINVPIWMGCWGGWGNGTCGVITDPNNSGASNNNSSVPTVTPKGYWMAQGVRTVYGPRWNVPTNGSGMLVLAATPSTGHFGVMILNIGNGNKSGSVALSHWPVNGSGTGSANVWQMTSAQTGAGMDGARSTVQVTNGVTASLSFPDPSITIISV